MKNLLLAAVGQGMKHIIYSSLLSFLLVASAAYGGVPELKVVVFDANGNIAFKGKTNAEATFATENLQPGNYVVQFNSQSASLKGNQYFLVISAGKKKVTATDIPGEMFHDAGVAMKVGVGKGLKITGQIASMRMVNNKRYVWLAAETGSNLGGHWVEAGVGDGLHVVRLTNNYLRKMQDSWGEGSLLNRFRGVGAATYDDGD
jgi:hypothetical protein